MAEPLTIEWIGRGVLCAGEHVLFCRQTKHGYLYLPGGHVEFGESAARAVEREFEEETGLIVAAGDCCAVAEVHFRQGSRLRHEVNVVFHVERVGTALGRDRPWTVESREKGIDFVWLRWDEIAGADVRPECLRRWMARFTSPAALPRVPTWISDTQAD